MAQDSAVRTPDDDESEMPGGACRCDFVARPWHAEMLGLERNGSVVGWALGCFEDPDRGWEPADVVTFIRQHNWADPASMEDLAGHIAFLADHVATTTSPPGPRLTPGDGFSIVLQVTVCHSAQGEQA